jgi:MFS family permease
VSEPRRRIHPAWVIFGVTFVTLLGASGFRAAPGLLVKALGESPADGGFGWTKAQVSTASFVNLVLFGLVGPFAAALMARFGLRRVVMTALCTVSAGAALTVFMGSLWQYVALWGVVVGLGVGCLSTVFAANVANRWFVARKGLVTGMLMAASAAGGLVFLPLLSGMAESQSWKWVSLTIAAAAFAMVPLVFFFLKDRPEDIGTRAYGAPEGHRTPDPLKNPVGVAYSALRDAWRSGVFWLLAGSFLVCGVSTSGLVMQHFYSSADDHGIGYSTAGRLMLLVGVFDVVGTIGSGWLTDRVDPRKLLFAYYGLRGLSLFAFEPVLARGEVSGPLVAIMIFYGLDWIATIPPTVALANQHFGARGPVVFGWLMAAHQIGGAAFALVSGALRDWTGSYAAAYLIAAIMCLVAAGAVLRIGRPAAPPAATPATGAAQPA